MKDKTWVIFTSIIGVFGILVLILLSILLSKVKNIDVDTWILILALLSQIIALVTGICYTLLYTKPQESTRKQIGNKLDDISQQMVDIKSTTSNSSEMFFLQSLAASIGDKGSNWKTEQIANFLQCMEFICKKEKQTSNGEAKEKPVNNGN